MAIQITDLDTEETPPSGGVSRYFKNSDVTRDAWGPNTLTDNTSDGTTTDAIRGDAKSFDGTDDYMDTGIQSLSTPFTVSLWTKTDTDDDTLNPLFGNLDSSGDDFDIRSDFRSSDNDFEVVYDKASTIVTDVGGSTIGDWHHVTVTVTSSAVKIYRNGAKTASGDGASGTIDNTANFLIGGDHNGRNATGDIDEVMLYNRALSSAEVAELYQWGGGGRRMAHRTVIQ